MKKAVDYPTRTGKVIQISTLSEYPRQRVFSEMRPEIKVEQTTSALVYQEAGAYIVAFGQPPYLWRKHNSIEEVMQTYFYFDWSAPDGEQDIGRTVLLVGEL